MGVIAQPDVVLFGRRLAADQAFVWLAVGTVLTIALASYLEEFIIKSLPHYDFFFTMAFFELAVFGVVSHVRKTLTQNQGSPDCTLLSR